MAGRLLAASRRPRDGGVVAAAAADYHGTIADHP